MNNRGSFIFDMVGVIAIVAVLGALIVGEIEEKKQKKACRASCGIVLTKMIDDRCHCATGKGWELK